MGAIDILGFWILIKIWTIIQDFILRIFCPSLIPNTDKNGVKIKPTWEIPGPTIWLPLLGDALTLNKFGGPEKFLDYVSSLHAKYGPIVKTKLGPQKFIFVNHPALYEEIVRSEPKCPVSFKLPSAEAFYEKHKIKRGLFFRDGEEWREGRTLLTQLLLKDTGRYMETLFDSVEPVLQRLMDNWTFKSGKSKDGHIQNIEQDCYEFFLSAIMTVTYGQHFETYLSQAGSSVTTLAIEAIKLNQSTFDLNAHPIQMATGLGLKCWKEYEAYTLNNLTIGRKCADIALETMAATGGSLEEFGLLYRLKNVCNASDEDIRVHCTDFTVDISDPVSLTLLWTLYALGRNLDVQEKILQEIEHVCGTGENVGYNDFQKLPYLNSTFKEVMRMFSTAQLVIRKNAKDVVLGGYNVTSDYIVALSTFSSHKNPALFTNPEQFWPERWLGEERDVDTGAMKRSENAYFPFGIGKRACAGKHLVQNLTKLFVAKIVQNFVVESDEVQTKLKIMLYPDGDMNIRLKPR